MVAFTEANEKRIHVQRKKSGKAATIQVGMDKKKKIAMTSARMVEKERASPHQGVRES